MDISTVVLHADDGDREPGVIVPAIAQAVNGAFASAEDFRNSAGSPFYPDFYTRHGNENHRQVASVVAALEGAEHAFVAASGMGAVTTAVLSLVGAGDHVVAQRSHYAGVANLLRNVLPRFGVGCTEVDQTYPGAFEAAMRPNTRLMMLETPTNPRLEVTDLAAVAAIARARGVITIVDNTFATPVNQQPLALGVDLSWHSATKYLGGHADLLAGVVAGPRDLIEAMWDTQLIVGSILAPYNAWLLLRGLRTLSLRVERHNGNALALALALAQHPRVTHVYYPGLETSPSHQVARKQMSGYGGLLSFELDGGHDAADQFLTSLTLVKRAPSLGAVYSLACQPEAYWGSHQLTQEDLGAASISPGLIRFATGIEHPDDLIHDVLTAIKNIKTTTPAHT
ncbi:MAG: trans-sulfuration enzyme family protein [Terriglobales bacterium]